MTGAITSFEANESGSGGGGGIGLPFIGGIGVKTSGSQAHIGLDIRIIRVKDAEVLVSKSMEGKAGRSSFGVGGGGVVNGVPVGGWFQSHQNTPIEEAVRDVLNQGLVSIMGELSQRGLAVTPAAPPQPGQQNTAPNNP